MSWNRAILSLPFDCIYSIIYKSSLTVCLQVCSIRKKTNPEIDNSKKQQFAETMKGIDRMKQVTNGFILIIGMLFVFVGMLNAQWQMEKLDRGVVAVKMANDGVFVGWRMLATDPDSIAFNVYRGSARINDAPITTSTNFVDAQGTVDDSYYVVPVLDGVEQSPSKTIKPWSQNYLSIPLQRPAGGSTPDGVSYTYNANDCSAADLDGDGTYEIVLKWDPSNSKDNSQSGYTGNVFLDGLKLDGTLLWRIDLGRNIRAGAHYTQFMVYDLDGDGKAEIACKTADGSVDGTGVVIGDPNADYRNSSGYILSGSEFFTIFNGETGAAITTVPYLPPRGSVSSWGDGYGNRVDRFLACVAYLDGSRPSVVMCRGYYTRTVLVAWDWRDGQLTHRWTFDSNNGYPSYAGQGNHNLSVGDVDGDGNDEIVYGSMAVDDDGSGLWNSGLGHGDAMHLADIDPNRPGLEVWGIHENAAKGSALLDARTGEILWNTGPADVGRGVSANLVDTYDGMECWGGTDGLRSCINARVGNAPSSANFAILWDGDLTRELLDGTTISKYNGPVLLSASGCSSNNGTNPHFSREQKKVAFSLI
jgi:rhamnogalacturonan endolyase